MSQRNANRAIVRAEAALENGRPEQAIPHLRNALSLIPGEPLASALMGAALLRLGQSVEAANWIKAAARAAPIHPLVRACHAELLIASGRAAEAQRVLAALVQAAPDFAQAWSLLGDAALALNTPSAALAAFARARALRPGDDALVLKLARTHAAAGDFAAAEAQLQGLSAGNTEAVFQFRAEMLIAVQDWTRLAALAEAWSRIAPRSAAAFRMAAAAAFEQGRFEDAAKATRAMLACSKPGGADWAAYGQICLQALDYSEAEMAFAKAHALAPQLPEVLGGRARLLTFAGKLKEAEACCRQALAADPARGDLWWLLCLQISGRFTSAERAHLQRLASNITLPLDQRAMAAMALGQGMEADGEIDPAAQAYAHAHALKRDLALRQGQAYDRQSSEAHFARLAARFAAAPAAAAPAGTYPRPIFIFGMPRSGTTLIEALLAGLPGMQDCGERPRLMRILETVLAEQGPSAPLDDARRAALAKDYFDGLALKPCTRFVIDKNPLNFQAAGLIAELFPDAVMIHTQRDAVETGLSIWRHDFKGWSFTDRLEDIGHFYGRYAKLMAHFAEVLGPRLITITYETFATDYAGQAEALLARIGLARPAPENSGLTPIATLSAVQVRQSVTLAAPRAPNFGAHLDPLRTALREGGVI